MKTERMRRRTEQVQQEQEQRERAERRQALAAAPYGPFMDAISQMGRVWRAPWHAHVREEPAGWFADRDDEATSSAVWQPCFQGETETASLNLWFYSEADCLAWIRRSGIIGAGEYQSP